MKILIVYAHPEDSSFNAAMKDEATSVFTKNGHDVKISDLYAMHFKSTADWEDFSVNKSTLPNQYGPAQKIAYEKGFLRSDITLEQEKIIWSELIIFQFPLWWFSMPAILKGWFDRVFTPAFSYDKGKWFQTSPLYGRLARLVVTTEAPASSYEKNGLNGDILHILQPIHHSLQFVGFQIQHPFVAYGVKSAEESVRKQYLEHYKKSLQDIENTPLIKMPIVSEYNEKLQLKNY